jgi:hypothetical protein
MGNNHMMRLITIVLLSAALAGCYSQAAVNERKDDENCRAIIAERNDNSPGAYDKCRANLMAYRNQGAIADSGGRTTINVNR